MSAKRTCTYGRCGGEFLDDGSELCPQCDSDHARAVFSDAAADAILAMREGMQERLRKESEEKALPQVEELTDVEALLEFASLTARMIRAHDVDGVKEILASIGDRSIPEDAATVEWLYAYTWASAIMQPETEDSDG